MTKLPVAILFHANTPTKTVTLKKKFVLALQESESACCRHPFTQNRRPPPELVSDAGYLNQQPAVTWKQQSPCDAAMVYIIHSGNLCKNSSWSQWAKEHYKDPRTSSGCLGSAPCAGYCGMLQAGTIWSIHGPCSCTPPGLHADCLAQQAEEVWVRHSLMPTNTTHQIHVLQTGLTSSTLPIGILTGQHRPDGSAPGCWCLLTAIMLAHLVVTLCCASSAARWWRLSMPHARAGPAMPLMSLSVTRAGTTKLWLATHRTRDAVVDPPLSLRNYIVLTLVRGRCDNLQTSPPPVWA